MKLASFSVRLRSKEIGGSSAGFTLIEMLVVIAIMGVLVAIGVQSVSNINEQTERNQAKTQARNVAQIYQAAKASGATVPGASLAEILDSISGGVDGAGQLSTTHFRLLLDEQQRSRITPYLTWTEAGILYTGAGED